MPQASLPSPRTWSPGDYVTVPRLRADAAGAAAFLSMRPCFIGQVSTGPSVATATATPLTMDAELTDAWNAHLTPASGVYAPVPGWYLCDARVPFAYAGTAPAPFMAGFTGLSNGAAIPLAYGAVSSNGSTSQEIIARAVDLLEQVNTGPPGGSGDYIGPVARQDSGSAVSLLSLATDLPTATIRWVCATTGTQPLPVPPLTACPSPITSSWLNANLRDAIRFLIYPPAAKAHYTAGSSSLANTSLASPAIVPLTTVDLDTYGGITTGASARYTAPVAGRYLLAGQVNLAPSSSTAYYACGLLVNGSAVYWGGITRFAGSSAAGGAAVTRRLRLSQGDTVQLIGAQNSGGSIAYNTSASNQTRLIAVWEGI